MKHVLHVVFFVVGAGLGISWGVNHPTEAAKIAGQEQRGVIVAKAKLEALRELGSGNNPQKYQQMVSDQQKQLGNAGQ